VTTSTPPAVVIAPYPAGTYTCIISIDGVIEGQTDFTIDFPNNEYPVQPADPADPTLATQAEGSACPVPPPVTGVPCYQWVPAGTQCNGFTGGSVCTCETGTGLWNCP
jgi:hypothetical protein